MMIEKIYRLSCQLPGCGYPVGECSGACMPIDLVEPEEPAPAGDRVPCHLFMPDVAWPRPLGPVLRSDACRLRAATQLPRPDLSAELLEVPEFGVALVTALSISLTFWLVALLSVLLVSSVMGVL